MLIVLTYTSDFIVYFVRALRDALSKIKDIKQKGNRQNMYTMSSHFALKVHVTEKSCEMKIINPLNTELNPICQ